MGVNDWLMFLEAGQECMTARNEGRINWYLMHAKSLLEVEWWLKVK